MFRNKEYYKNYVLNTEAYFKNKKARKKFIRQESIKRYKKDKFIIFDAIEEIVNDRLKKQGFLLDLVNIKDIQFGDKCEFSEEK